MSHNEHTPEAGVVDARGHLVGPCSAGRIVSVVPSVTETLFALGVGARVVGRTEWCLAPHGAVEEIPSVGGTKSVDVDRLLGLAPDLVIANHEENTREAVEAIETRVPVFVTYPRTVEAAAAMCADLSALTAAPDGGALASRVSAALAQRRARRRRDARTVTLVWWRPLMAAGPDTYVSDLAATFGGRNVVPDGGARYPETTWEALAALRPEIVLLPDEPFRFTERHADRVRAELDERGVTGVHAVVFDGSLATWFGARTLVALRELGGLFDDAFRARPR